MPFTDVYTALLLQFDNLLFIIKTENDLEVRLCVLKIL